MISSGNIILSRDAVVGSLSLGSEYKIPQAAVLGVSSGSTLTVEGPLEIVRGQIVVNGTIEVHGDVNVGPGATLSGSFQATGLSPGKYL